jgi:hypothetical protein
MMPCSLVRGISEEGGIVFLQNADMSLLTTWQHLEEWHAMFLHP